MATTIVVSELSGRIYQDLGWDPSRVYAIPNGVDTQRLGDARHREHVPMRTGNELHLGCVARLTQDKGVDLLVEAMATLPHATLDIVGDGPERENLRVRAREINAHIRFLGRVPDIAEFYRSLDILVLPSREHDPFGLAAAEAMLLGIPVVVTRACGIADELKNGVDGIVVQPGSATALREGIERLQDPAVRAAMGKKAAQTARETFSMTSMVQSYISVFTQAPQR